MKVLISGGRFHTAETFRPLMERAISEYVGAYPSSAPGYEKVTIIHGAARGADALADGIAEAHGFNVYRFPAEFKVYGRAAGPKRNQEMLDTMQPDLCLCFPLKGSIGTWNLAYEAGRRGIPTYVIRAGQEDVGPEPWVWSRRAEALEEGLG